MKKSALDLRRRVGQLLIMGFEESSMTRQIATMLREMHPAGVILFARNIQDARQTHALLRECARLVEIPMFLCVDMEGGTVDRLKHALSPSPSAARVFATGDPKRFREHGALIGHACRAFGFNTDFAPTLDLALPASQNVLGSRAVSSDPKQVVLYAREFIAGLRHAGVLGCGKHFPGLGDGNLDSHHQLPRIEKSMERLSAEDLVPYRTLHRRLPFILVSHAAYPAVSGDAPASLSRKWITAVLRKKVGYRGLIVSDDMEMGAVRSAAKISDAACQHIAAGGDMFLVCRSAEKVQSAFEAVLRKSEREPGFDQEVARASTHVLHSKRRRKELRHFPAAPTGKQIAALRTRMEAFLRELSA